MFPWSWHEILGRFFLSKKKFRMEIIKFLIRSLFIHAHFAESLVACILHVSSVTVVEKPEVVCSNPTVGHNFYMF